jgi:hypothetical protein
MMQIGSVQALLCVALGFAAAGCDERRPEESRVAMLHLGSKPGSIPTERRVEVVAVPKILQGKYGYSLSLSANTEVTEEVYYGSDMPEWIERLEPGGVARVIVWESKEMTSYYDDGREEYFTHRDLGEVWVGNTCVFDAAICPVHKARMERGLIAVHYGSPSREILDAFEGFSGGPGFTFGGCCVSSSDPKETFGYRCSECVAGYQEWSEKQQGEEKEDGQQAAPSDGDKPSN